jgi:hypothetical protein
MVVKVLIADDGAGALLDHLTSNEPNGGGVKSVVVAFSVVVCGSHHWLTSF